MSEPTGSVSLPPFHKGWGGGQYATKKDVILYANQRNAQEQALKDNHDQFNKIKDESAREQYDQLHNCIAELQAEKRTLKTENEKLQATNQELQAELKNENKKRPRSEDEAKDSQEQKKRRLEFIKQGIDAVWQKALEKDF